MNTPRGAAMLALVAGILVAGGCQSQSGPADSGKATAAKAAEKTGKVAKKGKAPSKMRAKPAAPPKGGAPDIGKLASQREVREQKRAQLVQHYLGIGADAFAGGRFDDARHAYGSVLELSPQNDEARRKLQEIGHILGDRGLSGGEVLERSVAEAEVRAEQARMEVANLVRKAKEAEGLGRLDDAVRYYERAMVIVRLPWGPGATFNPSEEGLKTMLDAARSSARQSAEAKRTRLLKESGDLAKVEAARERAAHRSRLQMLFKQANRAMEAGNYQTAQNLAEEVMRESPENKDAQRLRDIAFNAKLAERDEAQRKTLIDEWKHVFRQLDDAVTPQVEDYTFPTTWEEIQAKRAPTSLRTSGQVVDDPKDREVTNRLKASRTTVDFQETTITDAVDFLHRVSGANIVVLPDATEGKADDELQIDLKIDNPIAVDAILDLITRVKEMAWRVEGGVVQITTPEGARGPSFVQLYDVKDLATEIKNFPGDDINLDPTGEYVPEEEVAEPAPEFVLDSISELITTNVDTAVWDEAGSVEVLPPGTLVVKAPMETHRKVQALLDGLRGAGGLQVSIETRFITVTDNFLSEVGVDLRGLGDNSGGVGIGGKGGLPAGAGLPPVPVTFDDVFFGSAGNAAGVGSANDTGIFYNLNSDGDIRARFENLFDTALGKTGIMTNAGGFSFQGTMIDDTQLEVILRAVEKNDRSTVVIAPRLTAYNGQRANVTVLNQISYIADFDVEIAQAAQIGDPIVQTLRDGVVLDLRPTVSADRRYITMELRPTIAVLTRPIATFQTTLANGPPVTIQLPELRINRVRTTVTMPDGGTLLLGGLKFFEERRLESTVPWLGKIPVASFFLSHKGTYLEKRNLLVLIRARILRPEENEPGMGSR